MKTDEELVDEANELARHFYKMMGCRVNDDFKFYQAKHPQELLCWNMAVAAFEQLKNTDIEEALGNLLNE